MTQHTALEQAAQWLKDADGIVVCAANGLSMAEGFAILRPSPWFDSRFSDFVQKYGIRTPLQGLQTSFPRPEEFSRFYSRLISGIHYDKPVSPVMRTLRSICSLHPTFVLTTNVEDRFVQAGFPEQSVFYLEGRLTHRADHTPLQKQDLAEITSGDQLETAGYPDSRQFQEKLRDLNRFLAAHPRFVILELGVSAGNGFLRPLISQMLQAFPASRLAEFNLQPNPVPVQIRHRVVQVDGDLEQNLDGLARILLPEASGSQDGTS
ncbi:hypothetical protein [Faecalibaculum rodentium]|uniref:hypothetical protein n=2 Tax=Faecalibaculum rodentium TaxID=1702221 RepID=UPI0026F3FD92|nr:hypothetical protein [Faecalibaculum rodentium]